MHFCWNPPTETRVHWEKKGGKCMGEGHKKLNFSDCMGLAIGQIIGSGIMVLTGIVIGLTGHGIAAAFILGAVLAIITCVPFIILTSAIPSSGAGFTYIRRLLGEKAGFMYIAMFVLSQVLIATYAKGFASYFCSIFPLFGESAVAMAALVICTAINLVGLKSSALVQKGMVVLLLLSLFYCIRSAQGELGCPDTDGIQPDAERSEELFHRRSAFKLCVRRRKIRCGER